MLTTLQRAYFIMKWTSTQNVLMHFPWDDNVCVRVCLGGGGGGGGGVTF